ncbi:MAG: cupin domain-containing protein [Microthrixaceae bacterium]
MEIRRVVTGFDGERAAVLYDGPAPATVDMPSGVGASAVDLWKSPSIPLDTTSPDDPTTTTPFELMPSGALFRIIDLEPGDHTPLWHTTASVDFNYVVSGTVKVLLGDEAAVTDEVHLTAGDTFVHRGPRHAWVNSGEEVCRLVCSSVAAELPPDVQPS